MTQTYVFFGACGELVGVTESLKYGDRVNLDQSTAEAHILNDFHLIPEALFDASQSDPNPKFAAGIAYAEFRKALHDNPKVGPATPVEVIENEPV